MFSDFSSDRLGFNGVDCIKFCTPVRPCLSVEFLAEKSPCGKMSVVWLKQVILEEDAARTDSSELLIKCRLPL